MLGCRMRENGGTYKGERAGGTRKGAKMRHHDSFRSVLQKHVTIAARENEAWVPRRVTSERSHLAEASRGPAAFYASARSPGGSQSPLSCSHSQRQSAATEGRRTWHSPTLSGVRLSYNCLVLVLSLPSQTVSQ